MIITALALALAAPAANSIAVPKPGGFVIYGETPAPSCPKWTEERQGKRSQILQFWLLGFVSGYNVYGPEPTGGAAAGVDSTGILAWVDQYCAANPLDSVVTAAIKLVGELDRRSRPR